MPSIAWHSTTRRPLDAARHVRRQNGRVAASRRTPAPNRRRPASAVANTQTHPCAERCACARCPRLWAAALIGRRKQVGDSRQSAEISNGRFRRSSFQRHPATSVPGPGSPPATSAPGMARPCHICTRTGLECRNLKLLHRFEQHIGGLRIDDTMRRQRARACTTPRIQASKGASVCLPIYIRACKRARCVHCPEWGGPVPWGTPCCVGYQPCWAEHHARQVTRMPKACLPPYLPTYLAPTTFENARVTGSERPSPTHCRGFRACSMSLHPPAGTA